MEVELYSLNDLQKLCRLCMETASELYSLYDLTPLDDVGLHIQFVEMIIECTSLNIETDDGLPQSVCMECLNYLGTSYSFKQRCEKSDKKLRELMTILNDSKTADESHFSEAEELKENIGTANCDQNDVNISKISAKIENESETTSNKLDENETKPLRCSFCSKTFSCDTNLKLHLNTCQTRTINCGVCSKDFPNAALLKAHLSATHSIGTEDNDEAIHACDICDAIFSNKNKFLFHYRSHIDIATFYQEASQDVALICYHCNKTFTNVADLESHISTHSVDSTEFACRLCSFQSSETGPVKDHLKSHRISPLICNLCLLSFISSRKFRLHLKAHKPTHKSKYICALCEKHFAKKHALRHHIKDHVKDLHSCTTCSRSFLNLTEYESHQMEHNKSILCTICGKLFQGQSRLASHMLLHDGSKPFSCTMCEKSFRTKTILSNHELTHSDVKPYVCTWCGYSCRRSGDLYIHHRIHTGDRPYSCSFPGCGSKFKTSSFMHQHMRRHTGEGKIYTCELCGKTFTVGDSLKRHTLIHTNERPHKCEICGKCFRRKYHVTVHKAKLHGQ